nr:hypothetical protein [Tanacetum cinerariifolium]
IVPLFDTMLVHQGEGSGTPTEPHHTPYPEADTSHPTTLSISLLSLPTAPIPPVTQTDTTPIRDVSKGEACPTESIFIADQDRATIVKSSTLPHDSAPKVTSHATDEGSMQQTIPELTALCTSLQRQHSELLAKFQAQEVEILRLKERVQVLEDRESIAAKQSGDDAPINGRSINEGEAVAERISDDSEELARVLTSMKQRLQEQIDAQVSRELEEQQEKEDMRMNEQIARDAEVARIHAEEELQRIIDSLNRTNETIAKYIQEYQDFASELPLEKRIELISDLVKDFKGMTFKDIEAKFAAVWKHVEDFIPIGSKEDAERLKRKGFNLEQEQVKKQKTSEEAPKIKKSTEEIPKEKMKEMMLLVPVEEVYVQALQVKHPILDWKFHTEGQRSYWKIIRLGESCLLSIFHRSPKASG